MVSILYIVTRAVTTALALVAGAVASCRIGFTRRLQSPVVRCTISRARAARRSIPPASRFSLGSVASSVRCARTERRSAVHAEGCRRLSRGYGRITGATPSESPRQRSRQPGRGRESFPAFGIDALVVCARKRLPSPSRGPSSSRCLAIQPGSPWINRLDCQARDSLHSQSRKNV